MINSSHNHFVDPQRAINVRSKIQEQINDEDYIPVQSKITIINTSSVKWWFTLRRQQWLAHVFYRITYQVGSNWSSSLVKHWRWSMLHKLTALAHSRWAVYIAWTKWRWSWCLLRNSRWIHVRISHERSPGKLWSRSSPGAEDCTPNSDSFCESGAVLHDPNMTSQDASIWNFYSTKWPWAWSRNNNLPWNPLISWTLWEIPDEHQISNCKWTLVGGPVVILLLFLLLFLHSNNYVCLHGFSRSQFVTH